MQMADQELDIQGNDLVVIRISLRGRDGGEPVTLNESVTVADLGVDFDAPGGDIPAFDNERYTTLMAEGSREGKPALVEEALQMMADFQEQTAEFVAAGGTPPAETLAQGVVDWVLATQPKGHNYTNDPNGDGYVISPAEINIHGPFEMDGERVWRVTAVGTWGGC
jgi:hypothetical protein